ncbi:hypothetical protein SKAU_G00109580 [Synaphobranchus kaupii]|uniref:Uncharacterized protein n=1 Tax=Synaphobranchus kaupii TaxID=118154 RepID=A0A9Q1G0Z6_SYNKA|nr:hypothetical protein SKAU_G00109580 [Synaphobranchus kaupii]
MVLSLEQSQPAKISFFSSTKESLGSLAHENHMLAKNWAVEDRSARLRLGLHAALRPGLACSAGREQSVDLPVCHCAHRNVLKESTA